MKGRATVSGSGTAIASPAAMRPVGILLVVLAGAFGASAAQATEPSPRPYVLAFELGLIDSPRHQTELRRDGISWTPPEYAGVVLDGRVSPHLHLDGQFGLNFVQGWMASLAVRLAAEVSRLTVSLGAGPLVESGVAAGQPGVLADADVSAILHFEGPFVILFRAGAAWAIGGEGSAACPTRSCDSYLARGDRITFARLGVGSSF